MNTTDFLGISSSICPDRNAVIFEGKRINYSQLSERVIKLANAFHKLGIKKGEIIAMLQVNCPECIETYFACAKLGIIYLPVNFRAKDDELKYLLGHSNASALIMGKRYIDIARHILPDLPSIKYCIALEEKENGMFFYPDLVNDSPTKDISSDIEDDDVTVLMYTAGTTGLPKGVPLRHNGFVGYVLENVEPVNPEICEINILTVPLYHIAGIQTLLASIFSGRTLVLMRQFEVNEWMKTVESEQASRAMLVPTMLKYIIDSPDFSKYDLNSMKVITYGAAPMPFEVISKALKLMPWVKFINAFGQTETAATIAALGPEDHIIEGTEKEKQKKLKRLMQSIGKPLPDVQVKIVDEKGVELPRGVVGEIVARGPRIMTGYWQDEEKTAEAFTPDGWLITKDKGWMDQEGYIYLMGRGDDMIIRGGENISPGEIENVLSSYPKIEEVAVIGIPDSEWGQVPLAVCVLKKGVKATPEEMIEYCHETLASFKRPKEVVFTDELPRNPLGKVLKNKLREIYSKG